MRAWPPVELAAHLVAVDAGEVAVEDDHVVAVDGGHAERGAPVVGDVDRHAFSAQAPGDRVGHDLAVLYHEQSHPGIVARRTIKIG